MALFRILKGENQNLPTTSNEGWMYITEDTGDIHLFTSTTNRLHLNANYANKLRDSTNGQTLLNMGDQGQAIYFVEGVPALCRAHVDLESDQTIGGAKRFTGQMTLKGGTINGTSIYQFESATYRNPNQHTPELIIRADNATTGITGYRPGLVIYNEYGDQNITAGLTFASRETTSAGNAVMLASIVAIKESAGTNGAWSQGGLRFLTKNYGAVTEAMAITGDGNVGIGTTAPSYKLHVNGNGYFNGALTVNSTAQFNGRITISTHGKYLALGCDNASWAHYSTDSVYGHWFNKDVSVQGNIYAGDNYDKLVLHAGNYGSYALPLAGGTMTGTIQLASKGYQTNNIAGYYVDQFGNFVHTRSDAGDHWQIHNNAQTISLKYYVETGALNIPTSVTSPTFIGALQGNADTATKATQDGNGSVISSTYLKLAGGTMTGALNLANGVWNKAGDDVQFGDNNIAGSFNIQGLNGATNLRMVQQGGTAAGTITWNGSGFTFSHTITGNLSGNASTATNLRELHRQSFTTSGAGWYQLASATSTGRGLIVFQIRGEGGSSSPSVATVTIDCGWNGASVNNITIDGSASHIRGIRITKDASGKYYLEMYCSSAVPATTTLVVPHPFLAHNYINNYWTWTTASSLAASVATEIGTSLSHGSYGKTTTGNITANAIYGAVWNDYAEFRGQEEIIKPGYCAVSSNSGKLSKTTSRLQACDGIVSDTFGFSIGETDDCKTPLAVAGRVLAYYEGDRYDYNAGDTVCATAGGLVSKMTREEIKEYPDRIVGIVSEIPEYDTWGTGNVEVNGRIWIKVK